MVEPAATSGVVIVAARSWRVRSDARKYCVSSLTTAPPSAKDPCNSESGVSGGMSGAGLPLSIGGTQVLVYELTHCSSAEKVVACAPPGRPSSSASPCVTLVPDLVTMFTAVLEVQPNSAENARDMTVISCTAPTGSVENIVWRPHGSSPVAPSTM